jgi:hypothetical protein
MQLGSSLVGAAAGALATGNTQGAALGQNVALTAVTDNYLKHNPVAPDKSELNAFAKQLASCKATQGCNVDAVYEYWAGVSAKNQAEAKESVATWASTGDAASLGEFLAGATGALGANPANFCDAGDARCYNFIQSQNTQSFSAYRDAVVFFTSLEYVNRGPSLLKPQGSPAKGGTSVAAGEIRFSQNTVSYQKTGGLTYEELVQSMKTDGWQGAPVDAVRMPDGKLTSIDNTRIAAAREAGIDVQVNVRDFNSPLTPVEVTRFTRNGQAPSTWGEAITLRIDGQSGKFGVNNPYGSDSLPKITGKP